jgi:hypothetical protein
MSVPARAPRRGRPVELSLRGILVTVLAMPIVAVQACDSSSAGPDASEDAGAEAPDGSADGAEDGGIARTGPCAPVELDGSAFDDSGSGCSRYFRWPCGLPPSTPLRGCLPELATCVSWCASSFRCQLTPDVTCRDGSVVPDADVVFECIQCATGGGRKPRGLAPAKPARARSKVGAYFAELAHLEAASVVAFRDLARSLSLLGAPPSLVRAAERAVRDERRHAGTTRRLAQRFGAYPSPPRITRAAEPSLEELLADNAVEGCVGESYGALVAMWQAARATDPGVAAAMGGIARDEAQHASLSWELLRWGAPRLEEAARERLRARFASAVGKLRAGAEQPVDASVVELAGHPPPEVARVLTAQFERFVVDESETALGRRAA